MDLSGFQTLRETILDEFQKIKQDMKLVEINIRFNYCVYLPFFKKTVLQLSQAFNILMNYLYSKNRGGIETAKLLSLFMELAPELVSVNAAYNFMPDGSTAIVCSALKAARGNEL